MPTNPEFHIETTALPHLVRIRYFGRVTPAGVKGCHEQLTKLLPQMQPGFTVLTDLSELESMELDCVGPLTKIMDDSRAAGVGTVVRVIPDRDKDIGFNILSIIHYKRAVQIITCETLAEAEQVLAQARK